MNLDILKVLINISYCLFFNQPKSPANSLSIVIIIIFLSVLSFSFLFLSFFTFYFYLEKYFDIIFFTNRFIIYVLDTYRYYNRYLSSLTLCSFSSWCRCKPAHGRSSDAPAGRLAPLNLGRSWLVQ